MSPTTMAKTMGGEVATYCPPLYAGTIGVMGAPYHASSGPILDDPWQGDHNIPLPKGIQSLEHWGKVINQHSIDCRRRGRRHSIDCRLCGRPHSIHCGQLT